MQMLVARKPHKGYPETQPSRCRAARRVRGSQRGWCHVGHSGGAARLPGCCQGVMAVAAMAVLDGSGGGSSSADAAQSQNLLHAAGHVPSCLWSHPHPPISSMLTDSLRLWRNMCWSHRGTVLILQHLGYK